jgi:hypothetical protein
LTNVRSATRGRVVLAALLAVVVGAAWNASPVAAQESPSVTLAILPSGTEPEDLGSVPGLSPGVLSAGLSKVTEAQTFLDISQGNRVFTSLYDRQLPIFTAFGDRVPPPEWAQVLARADSAPAEIFPGLLGSTLREAGIPVSADRLLVNPALAAVDREGRAERTRPFACLDRRCPGFSVLPATLLQLPALIRRQRGDDLLIALERPPPDEHDVLAIGIAGDGFNGNLTSDTTRTSGFVLATDIAPTILERFGLDVPGEMSGEPIRTEGEVDAAAVADRAARMRVVATRRVPVIVDNLLIWLVAALAVVLATRGRWARQSMAALGLTFVYLLPMLLAAAALEPSLVGERLLVGLGAPLLAVLTLWLARGWSALAIACGVAVCAYALDVVAGSPLTARSLLGPNPALGVRFFGIGNELESALAVLIPVGVGAGLTALAARDGREIERRRAIGAFLGAGVVGTVLFASGRFGADVGAAIVFPVATAVAIVSLPGVARGRRLLLLAIAAPVVGLAVLALLDLTLGGDSHLSRSVFDAGGAHDLADVAERRLRLSAKSFNAATGRLLFWVAVAMVGLAIGFRHRIATWLSGAPLARAGFLGAAAGVALGMVANDSGAIFLTIGAIGLGACLAFAWAQSRAT